jgi:hypothetical protein
MIIQPNPSFPLLAGDQADVIRIFIELLQDRSRAASGAEVKTVTMPYGSRNVSHDSGPPTELYDYE